MAMQVLECILEPLCASKDYFSTKFLLDGLVDELMLPTLVAASAFLFWYLHGQVFSAAHLVYIIAHSVPQCEL